MLWLLRGYECTSLARSCETYTVWPVGQRALPAASALTYGVVGWPRIIEARIGARQCRRCWIDHKPTGGFLIARVCTCVIGWIACLLLIAPAPAQVSSGGWQRLHCGALQGANRYLLLVSHGIAMLKRFASYAPHSRSPNADCCMHKQ